jgi:hypothetical protein
MLCFRNYRISSKNEFFTLNKAITGAVETDKGNIPGIYFDYLFQALRD